jgi:hypothetical protein
MKVRMNKYTLLYDMRCQGMQNEWDVVHPVSHLSLVKVQQPAT